MRRRTRRSREKPSADWLNWVVSSKARTKIRQQLDEALRKLAADGRELTERRLKNWKLEWSVESQNEFCKKHGCDGLIAMYAAIAEGTIDVNEVKEYILGQGQKAEVAVEDTAAAVKRSVFTGSGDDILVLNAKDVKGLQYKMARCCNPVFGDDVFGFVTRGEGIKIHRISCPNAARLLERYPYRIQRVVWQETQSTGEFLATLSVTAEPDRTVMSSIMDIIAQFRVSMRSFVVNQNARTGDDEIVIKLLVPSNSELDKVISLIGRIKHVLRVRRS